jgi:hypothetical protein
MWQAVVMELTQSEYERIADCLPKQRGSVNLTNLAQRLVVCDGTRLQMARPA